MSNFVTNIRSQGGLSPLYAYPFAALGINEDVQYATGDAKWIVDNVITPEINTWPNAVTRPRVFPELDPTDNTLLVFGCKQDGSGDNIFGNKQRYTDDLGGQTYASNYMIDHYLGWGYAVFSSATATTWELGIAEIEALTFNSFSNWHMPPLGLYFLLANYLNNNPLENITLLLDGSSRTLHASSTTRSNDSTQCMAFQTLLRFGFLQKTTSITYNLIFRKAFTYNATSEEMELN